MPPTPARTLPLATAACCGIGVDGGLGREAAETQRGPAQGGGRPGAPAAAQRDPRDGCRRGVRLRPHPARRAWPSRPCRTTSRCSSRPGLLEREKRGTWAWFRLVPSRLDDVAAIFR